MTNNKLKFALGIAASGLATFSVVSPALAVVDIDIKGNGSDSHQHVSVSEHSSTNLTQVNTSRNYTRVKASADTGRNKASGNTGSGADIDTGFATTTVTVLNKGNQNSAVLPDCGCEDEDINVDISDNGTDSHTSVSLRDSIHDSVYQDNYTRNKNKVRSRANTGRNRVKDNTGGQSTIFTSDSSAQVDITNQGNTNTLD